jgi:macrolide transport system ATP-binding/permease protein
MHGPLLELRQITRSYSLGGRTTTVLNGIDLTIQSGEMVAIVGPSGSGKSTLMSILGCLDRPTSGTYRVGGRDITELTPTESATLRREHFGFVFQRYQLIGALSVIRNVEIPAIYARQERTLRRERARLLLQRLNLGDRLEYLPTQLSGGQQQKVCIARALMNGGQVLLADEPTGALDRQSGAEVLRILDELHGEGHTIIMVTHDIEVATHAGRIVEISDGRVISDRSNRGCTVVAPELPRNTAARTAGKTLRIYSERLMEALAMTFSTMAAHRLRTLLTMFGIVIGVTSVTSVVALGEGTRQHLLSNIVGLSPSTIQILPGTGFSDVHALSIHTLTAADADALAQQSYFDSVTPIVSTQMKVRHGDVSADATVHGVGERYFRVNAIQLTAGAVFVSGDVDARERSVVIDDTTRRTLFSNTQQPIGEIITIGSVPCRIVGVSKTRRSFESDRSLTVYVPYTTILARMLRRSYLNTITVRVSDRSQTALAQDAIRRLLRMRHGREDFFLFNEDAVLQTIQATSMQMQVLISSIAAITLLVGGIGVMNIMLVSVVERTREIGIRIAVGARQSDIMMQFLFEAITVCLLGGALGVLIALGISRIFSNPHGSISMEFSPAAILVALTSSTVVGIVFGLLPARNAARLNPVEALARD